jgi:acetolactate synthase I/III small subunit
MTKPISLIRKNSHTISMMVANKPGVLVRIAHVFARRGYNIDSLVVSPSFDPRFSRMTVTALGAPEILEQIIKQVNKLIDVIHAGEHTGEDAVDIELALVKVKVSTTNRPAVVKIIKPFHGRIIDDTDDVLIIAQMGTTAQLDQVESALKKFGLQEMVRTGKLVMAKGKSET